MKHRRVLLLLSQVFANGGVQRFNRTLLAAIETLGCECDVYSLADDEAAHDKWQQENSGLHVRTFGGSKPRFALAVIRAVASGRYDDVIIGHVHFLRLVVNARLIGSRRSRLLLVAHGVEVWNRLHGGRRAALSSVERILCVSEYTAQSMREQAPAVPAHRFSVFPNALADVWVAKVQALSTPRAAARGASYILSVARLTRYDRTKGIIHALEAFAQLADRQLRFVIAGTGDDLPFLRQIAERLGVAERVDFPGAVSDSELVALYRECQAFVLPSSQEGFGIVFLEAMYFGAPVIAAREKGAVDVIRHGETGLLVPYGDVAALGAAMTRVLGDFALRDSLRTAARANVTGDGCFTASAFTSRLASLLDNVDGTRQYVFVNRYFHPDESATSRMLSDLARRLSRAGLRVAVVTSRQLYDDPAAQLPAESQVDGIAVHRVSTATLGRGTLIGRALDYLTFHLAAGARLRRLLRPGDVVIAKTDPPMLSVTVARAARVRGAVLINWLQDVFPEAANELGVAIRPAWLATWLRRMRNASLRQAECNVAIGARMAERLMAQGVPAAKVRVIPNWADVAEIIPKPVEGNPIRAELGLRDHFVVGYSGNLGRAHEFETFLEAAALLRDDPAFVFLITGGGAKIAALRRDVETRGLRNFRFQPYQPAERLADSMAAADVHLVSLLPQIEGLIVPSKFYGILAAGRPAIFIGDADGELAREIRSGDCGVAIGVGDSAGLARELRQFRADPALLARLGSNARKLAQSRYSSERALQAWLAMIASIAPPAAEPVVLAGLQSAQSGR